MTRQDLIDTRNSFNLFALCLVLSPAFSGIEGRPPEIYAPLKS